MNKRKRFFLISILSLLLVGSTTILLMFYFYKKKRTAQPPYFDLFIVELFHKKDEEYPWSEFWNNAWQEVSEKDKRPIEWLLDKKEFEKKDSVYLGFKNTSNEKMYYVTWGAPNSRIREHFIVYRKRKVDSIPFGGFGCGTGIHLAPLPVGEVASGRVLNPLLYNLQLYSKLPVHDNKFPKLFKEVYGDSVSIYYEQATYSLPWNKIPSQMIRSNTITISTERVIENLKNRKKLTTY